MVLDVHKVPLTQVQGPQNKMFLHKDVTCVGYCKFPYPLLVTSPWRKFVYIIMLIHSRALILNMVTCLEFMHCSLDEL